MSLKVLIVGNTSKSYHLGSILIRAAKSINIEVSEYTTDISSYAPSMATLWGKAFFKVVGKRPFEWPTFNKKLIVQIEESNPDLVLVTGISPLSKAVFEVCKKLSIPIVNYLTDSPWSRQNSHRFFRKNLHRYTLIFSTKKDLISSLSAVGAGNIVFLPFAYDPTLHHMSPDIPVPEEVSEVPDVCLIGGADKNRIGFIKSFLENYDGSLGLYGEYWRKDSKLSLFYKGAVYGTDFRRVVYGCKLNLGIVRRANRDGHSMRSYEIAACGGVGIYENTPEHRELFKNYPDYGFFNSPTDLAEKCNWLLTHPSEREAMRQLAIRAIVKESNTYAARLKTILQAIPT